MNPEWRTGFYWLSFRRRLPQMLANAPHGDGHSVMVLPGFLASDRSTRPLRGFLRLLGYQVHGWKQGRNMGPGSRIRSGMAERLVQIYQDAGKPVSLVGWSLGGIYARELARSEVAPVRRVITLGSPFQGGNDRRTVGRLFNAVNPRPVPGTEPHQPTISQPLSVPMTAIYSRNDGIVNWHSCMLAADELGPNAQNVEVHAPHCALGVDPATLMAIADTLAQRPA